MRIPDFHVHTTFSPDSKITPEEAMEAALRCGVTDLCFTDHMDLGHPKAKFDHIPPFVEMKARVNELREAYPQLNLRFGLEAGYMEPQAEAIVHALNQTSFDYVLLSTHCMGGVNCYDPQPGRLQEKEIFYKRYLEAVYQSVTDPRLTDCYDCVAHIGFIAKACLYDDNTFAYDFAPDLFDAILKRIIQDGKGIEVNTSGVARAGHLLPHPTILKRYQELGGRIITVGSDAHTTNRVGGDVKLALQTLRACGFAEYTLFADRIPEQIPLA